MLCPTRGSLRFTPGYFLPPLRGYPAIRPVTTKGKQNGQPYRSELMNESEILRHIQIAYGAMIAEAACKHRHRPEVMAGIVMRESHGGLSPLLDCPGPEGRGDC
jgi:hypothetical protein